MFSSGITGVFLASLLIATPGRTQTTNAPIVSIPREYTVFLPSFTENGNLSFVQGTSTSDGALNDLLARAAEAAFISYDDEFLELLGDDPQVTLVEERENAFAYEGGIWIPELNQVWFTSSVVEGPSHAEILELSNNTIYNVSTTGDEFLNPNGGYYFNDSVWFATFRNRDNFTGGVMSIDPRTMEAKMEFNSYFGLHLNDPDDIAWATDPKTGKSYMYITTLPYAPLVFPGIAPAQLTIGIWRFDPSENELLPVISINDVARPNGARASVDGKTLYVTDYAGPKLAALFGDLARLAAPAVYKYDLDDEMMPVNRRVFSYSRLGSPDGLHVDDKGRVWIGDGEGMTVHNAQGKVLGVFNAQFFEPGTRSGIANFALAGDEVVVLAGTHLWRVKLNEKVASRNN